MKIVCLYSFPQKYMIVLSHKYFYGCIYWHDTGMVDIVLLHGEYSALSYDSSVVMLVLYGIDGWQ